MIPVPTRKRERENTQETAEPDGPALPEAVALLELIERRTALVEYV